MDSVLPTPFHIVLGLLALGLLALGLKAKGLPAREKVRGLIVFLVSLAIALGVFYLALARSVSDVAAGKDSFAFAGPAFQFVFNLSAKINALIAAYAPKSIAYGTGALFLFGVLSLVLFKWRGWRIFWVGLAISVAIKAQALLLQNNYRMGWRWYLVAIAAAAVSSLRIRNGEREAGEDAEKKKRIGLLLIPILLITLFNSFYRIDQYLYTVNDYEVANGLSALQILEGDPQYHAVLWSYIERDYQGGSYGPFAYGVALLFRLFEPTIGVLRASGAFWALACVAMLYRLLADLYGARTGLIGAFILSVSPWFLGATHLGIYLSMTIFNSLLFLFLLNRALYAAPYYYPLAGMVLGFYSYFYVPSKTLLPLAIILWIHRTLTSRRFARHFAGGLVLLICFYLFASLIAPPRKQIIGVSITDHFIGGTAGQTGGFDLKWAISDIVNNLEHFYGNLFDRAMSWAFPTVDAPLMHHAVFFLALIGAGVCLGRAFNGKYFFPLACVLVFLLPVTLISPMVDRGATRRGILLIAPICALAALALDAFISGARRAAKWPGGTLAGIVAAALLFIVGVNGITVYFTTPSYTVNYHRDIREFSETLVERLGEGYHVDVLLPRPQFSEWLVEFLAYPQVKKLYYTFGGSPDIWGQPRREIKEANPYYRFWTFQEPTQSLEAAESYPGKSVLLIANPDLTVDLMAGLRAKDPPARIEEIKNRAGAVIGYEYYPITKASP